VAFSPQGTYVATGGLDGAVNFWRAHDGKLLHRFEGTAPVLSLAWVPSGEETLLFGTKIGDIGMLTVSTADFSMNGFNAHNFPIEKLAIMGDYVASGAFGELKVWQWRPLDGRFALEYELPEPPTTSHNEHQEVLVTSLHWTGTEHHPQLMVTYMYHGVHLFDAHTWESVHTISLQGKIASASLSEDGLYLAISNLTTGFDVYRTDTQKPVGSYKHDIGDSRPTPVLFIHGGHAIVGGSTVGIVNIWDI
ncbi:WD40-repeat-containing domain protein, partial [Earliella scabrosa]